MNKYNSESYADQFTPFERHVYNGNLIQAIITDNLYTRDVVMVCMSIEPTALIKSQPDCCVFTEKEEFQEMLKRLSKKM